MQKKNEFAQDGVKRMKRKDMQLPSFLLSYKEEENLSLSEKEKYYEQLREFCINRRLTNTTFGATVIGPKLKKITGKICAKVCTILSGGNVKVKTDGLANIPGGPVIFASTHQGMLDGFVWITDCPKHALIFHGAETNKALLLAQVNTGLILVSRDKNNVENRRNAKMDLVTVLLRGHSVYICPEGTWNLSPSKLHLPINWGMLDVAKKAAVPIVPMVIEYTYDTTKTKETITHIHIRYGEAITVTEEDDLFKKMEEYEEKISTMRWELIEEKGLFSRKEISNRDYINYLKGNLKNLEMGKIYIEVENHGIKGAEQDFYRYFHINNVPWDAWGNLLQTEEVRRLEKINRLHGI